MILYLDYDHLCPICGTEARYFNFVSLYKLTSKHYPRDEE